MDTSAEFALTKSRIWQPMLAAAVRLGIDLKLFIKLCEASGATKTCDELAEATKSDPALLSRRHSSQHTGPKLTSSAGRLLKQLATANIVKEVGPDCYAATATSDTLATSEGPGPLVDWCVLLL